jgi:prepilin-type N-terminal cleavage/methylation domain-containing protein
MKSRNAAFTLIEVVVAAFVVALIAAIATPALNQSRINTQVAQGTDTINLLNQAAYKARAIDQISGSGTVGSNKTNALAWYYFNGYVDPGHPVNINYVDFTNGVWVLLPPY